MSKYSEPHRNKEQNIEYSYILPTVTKSNSTILRQEKNGVVITTEVIPYILTHRIDTIITAAEYDMNDPDFDVYESKIVPSYSVKCQDINSDLFGSVSFLRKRQDQIVFKITIKNNELVPLKLSDVGFALLIDDKQYSFNKDPIHKEVLEEWNSGLILTGFEKSTFILGPTTEEIQSAKSVRLFINGVPTKYNEAGTIVKKDNYEWFFDCKLEKHTEQEQIKYIYNKRKVSGAHVSAMPSISQSFSLKGAKIKIKTDDATNVKITAPELCVGIAERFKYDIVFGLNQSGTNYVPVYSKNIQYIDYPNPYHISYEVVNYDINANSLYWYGSYAHSLAKESSRKKIAADFPIILSKNGKSIKVVPLSKSRKRIIKSIKVSFPSGSEPVVKKGIVVQ